MESEKEKMIAGKPYLPGGKELSIDRMQAKEVCHDINTLSPREVAKRNKAFKKLFGKTSKRFYIEPPFYCDYGYNIEVGNNFYANHNLVVLDCAKVCIGDNVMIAPNVALYTAGHPIHHELRNQEIEYALPITIGNNVWIGGNVVVNPGVTIGDNTVIGSGSVLTKDIPSNVIAVGNPCKVLRQITDEDKQYYYKRMKIK